MGKKICKITALLLVFILLFTGCWDATDIENRDICTAVILDREDDDYVFYMEIAQVLSKTGVGKGEQESGSQQPRTITVKGRGKTLSEARLAFDLQENQPVYLGAVQTLILTEQEAAYGIEDYVLRLRQLVEYRKTMDVIVTVDKPEDLLNHMPENEMTVGFAVRDTMNNLHKEGILSTMSLEDLLQKHSSKNRSYLLPVLSSKKGQVEPIGYMVMHEGKKIGFIPLERSRGIVYLSDRRAIPIFNYELEADGTSFTVEAMLTGRRVKLAEGGEAPKFQVSLTFDAHHLYPAEPVTVTPRLLQEIGDALADKIAKEIRETMDQSQKEFHCDYLSFSEPFRIAYPDVYEEKNWGELFEKASFDVQVTVKMRNNRFIDYDPKPRL